MRRSLHRALGRQPSEGELYIAHFLGPDGAVKLINAMPGQPNANAAQMFPQAAAANPSIFLNKSGQPRSVSEVYATLTGRFEVARAVAFGPDLRGSQAATPDPAVVTQAYANAAARPLAVPVPVPAVPPDQRPLFQSMFSDRGNQPVAQAVSSLWTPPDADAQVKTLRSACSAIRRRRCASPEKSEKPRALITAWLIAA